MLPRPRPFSNMSTTHNTPVAFTPPLSSVLPFILSTAGRSNQVEHKASTSFRAICSSNNILDVHCIPPLCALLLRRTRRTCCYSALETKGTFHALRAQLSALVPLKMFLQSEPQYLPGPTSPGPPLFTRKMTQRLTRWPSSALMAPLLTAASNRRLWRLAIW